MARFVYFYTHLSESFDTVAANLDDRPVGWLPPPAIPDGEAYLVDVAADGALPPPLDRVSVRVRLGPATADDEGMRRPLRWTAAVALPQLFPTLAGELELQRLPADVSRLSLSGTYHPPGWQLGEVADRLAGHRVAEACVRRFVLDTAHRLTRHADPEPYQRG